MPRFDRTGPEGAGALTGWGDGDCKPEDAGVEVKPADTPLMRPTRRRPFFFGRRWSRAGGRGWKGRGRGRRFS